MKKLYTLLVIALIGFVGNAQIVNIPDATFKAKLLAASTSFHIASTQIPNASGQVTVYTKIDTNNDGEIQTSEALAIKWLGLGLNLSSSSGHIMDMTGINSFANLLYLNCGGQQLTTLDATSLTNLKTLHCNSDQLTSINVSGLTNLQTLNCSVNQLTTIDVSSLTNLLDFNCQANQLPSIDVSILTNLQTLNCGQNLMPSIDVNGLTNLKTLGCGYNQLTTLDLSGVPNLETLGCSNNQLPSIDLSPVPHLTYILCSGNLLTGIDVSGLTNLNYLYCYNNQITSLDVTGVTHLVGLGFENNQISSIDVSGLIHLVFFSCHDNLLPSLNVSGLTDLYTLDCGNNPIPSLNLNGLTNLGYLECVNNQLTTLNLTGLTSLQFVDCRNNQLTAINVNGLPNFHKLYCNDNLITTIDVSGVTTLQELYCDNNPLTSLFIKNGAVENLSFASNPNLEYICADDNQISQIQNLILEYNYNNCHVNSYCSFVPGGTFYTIQGENHYDSNNNGCEITDVNYPNLKLNFTNGTNAGSLIPDPTGIYQYDVQAGTHTLTPVLENPNYFIVSPTTATVTFPTSTSPYTQNFCITADGIHQDIEMVLLPMNEARPGAIAHYKIIYKNKASVAVDGFVKVDYSGSSNVMVFNYASVPATNPTPSELQWDYTNLQPFETRTITFGMLLNSTTQVPPLNNGSTISFSALITPLVGDEYVQDNHSQIKQNVVNSHDPNDKTCIEGDTVGTEMINNYAHYIIRFENTGTANALNIVVKDLIDTAKFDSNSLIPLSGSAQFITRITNTNQVEFIFENINLPFDDDHNDGYVAFKIKTKPTLVVGDTFSNSASIYFDYNAPIVTNTYMTTITALSAQDFDFETYFSVYPNPAKQVLNLEAKATIGVKSINIYNMLGQMVIAIPNAESVSGIDVSDLKIGTYFIKVNTDMGTGNTKFIKE